MPLTLNAINAELAKRGHNTLLQKGSGYFYFMGGESANWLDKTVRVPRVSSLTLEEWMTNFDRLKKLNERIMSTGRRPTQKTSRK